MPPALPSSSGAGLKTILVIDDDMPLAEALMLGLQANGYHTLVASNAARGWELARAHLPDLILCDIKMPGKDGRRLLQEMRADPELADRQFVLMTGNAAFANPRSGMDLGADDFLIKPFMITDLVLCVAARLKRAEITRRIEDRVVDQLRASLHSTLPHEFFTPLAGILGLADLLDEELGTLDKGEMRQILQDIRRSCRRLHRTLRNYLFILELETTRADGLIAALPAQAVVEALANGASAAAERHKRAADLALDLAGASLKADPSELILLAEELVDNALSFSRKGTPVRVGAKPSGAVLRLSVADTGRGMTPQQLQQLGAFQQHDRKKFEQQGLGLGLALVRKLVQHLGGEFRLESEAGKGTTSHVTLPIRS